MTPRITRFSKVAKYKINTKKSTASLYTNNEMSDKEISKIIPFIISQEKLNILHLRINLTGLGI